MVPGEFCLHCQSINGDEVYAESIAVDGLLSVVEDTIVTRIGRELHIGCDVLEHVQSCLYAIGVFVLGLGVDR